MISKHKRKKYYGKKKNKTLLIIAIASVVGYLIYRRRESSVDPYKETSSITSAQKISNAKKVRAEKLKRQIQDKYICLEKGHVKYYLNPDNGMAIGDPDDFVGDDIVPNSLVLNYIEYEGKTYYVYKLSDMLNSAILRSIFPELYEFYFMY